MSEDNFVDWGHIEQLSEEEREAIASDTPELDAVKRERDEAIEKLENYTASSIHTCHNQCKRPMCVLRRERDEALRKIAESASNCPSCGRHDYGLLAPLYEELDALHAQIGLYKKATEKLEHSADYWHRKFLENEVRHDGPLKNMPGILSAFREDKE